MNREDALRNIGEDLVQMIRDQADAVGMGITDEIDALALYTAERTDHLSLLLASGEPGFQEALIAERDNVLLRAAAGAVNRADDFDTRLLTIAAQGLRIAAMALAAV